jgi:phosphatidylserine/phosphatidylglycerophosphate/cardiolipin synthase-like enzyme
VIELVESVPIETDFDLPSLRDAPAVWLEMIQTARQSVDIGAFYISARPEGEGALAPLLAALAQASARGVRVRTLTDAGFYRTYPEIVDRLGDLPGAESRQFAVRRLWGGVMHAKYFLIDDSEFFLGSQNWDWRALEHIRELGVRIRHPGLTTQLQRIFDLDWKLAAGDTAAVHAATWKNESLTTVSLPFRDGTVDVTLAASPPQALPAGIPWDEPLLVEMIDRAEQELCLQLLSYNPTDRDGNYYPVLENALRRAAARGVRVRIVLANWSKRHYLLPHIQSLAALPAIEIRFSNLPAWSGGFVPYARVEHAKYLVADGQACWLGTANWARSYFHTSRNISLFCSGQEFAAAVREFFNRGWDSPFAETVDPCGQYEPPRIGE